MFGQLSQLTLWFLGHLQGKDHWMFWPSDGGGLVRWYARLKPPFETSRMPHLMIPVSEVQAGSRHMESRTGRFFSCSMCFLCVGHWIFGGSSSYSYISYCLIYLVIFSRHIVKSALQLQDYIRHHPTISKQGQVLKKTSSIIQINKRYWMK